MNRPRRYGPRCRAPLGETHMIGSARSPRPHERDAALTLAWRSVVGTGFALPRDRGAASSVQVSRSRAMPVGDRRSTVARHPALGGTRRDGNRPDGWGLRRRGPAGRCADRRSAFQAVLAPLLDGRYAVRGPVGGGAGPHRENWPEVGVLSRPRASSLVALRSVLLPLSGRFLGCAVFISLFAPPWWRGSQPSSPPRTRL